MMRERARTRMPHLRFMTYCYDGNNRTTGRRGMECGREGMLLLLLLSLPLLMLSTVFFTIGCSAVVGCEIISLLVHMSTNFTDVLTSIDVSH